LKSSGAYLNLHFNLNMNLRFPEGSSSSWYVSIGAMRSSYRNHLSTILMAALFGVVGLRSNAAEKVPKSADLVEYAFTGFCTEFITQIHDAKSIREKELFSRGYYGAIFAMWFRTANPRVPHIIDYDVSGNASAFLRFSTSLHFKELIDLDDPLNKKHVPKEVYSNSPKAVEVHIFNGFFCEPVTIAPMSKMLPASGPFWTE
jgi:hypothetical protein